MKAIVLKEYGETDQLTMQDWPDTDPQEHEVRIRIRAAAFNPVDYKLRQGRFEGKLPMVLGSDVAGVIDAVGPCVTTLKVGDEVYAYLGGPRSNGGYAEAVCVPEPFVAPKPKKLDFAQAAAAPMVGLTAFESMVEKARVRKGDTVFIAGGAGGVGSIAIRLAQHLGVSRLFTTAGSEPSFNYVTEKLGVDKQCVLRYRGLTLKQMKTQLLEMNDGHPVDAAFDFWGADMKRLCCQVIGFDGRVVSIVEEPAGFDLNVWNASRSPMFSRSASLHFEFVGARGMFGKLDDWRAYRRHLDALGELFDSGSLLPPDVADAGSLSEETVRKAHTTLEQGHVHGKLVMHMPG